VPDYTLQQVTGKAHQQSFEVSCGIPTLELTTTGQGKSRKDAEQEAAKAMLTRIEQPGG
jgi:ribonuclease-3